MACLDLVAKYLLLCVNFVVTLISILIIGIGALVVYLNNSTPSPIPVVLYLSIAILITGCLVFIIASFGSCGALTERPCLFITYAVLMACLFGGCIFLSVMYHDNAQGIHDNAEQSLESVFDDSDTRPIFMVAEAIFRCCGTKGPESYVERNLTISATCCPNPSLGNVTIDNIPDLEDINQLQMCRAEDSYNGCSVIVLNVIDAITNVIYYIIIAIVVIQSIGILSSIYLAYEFRTKEKVDEVMMYPHPHARLY